MILFFRSKPQNFWVFLIIAMSLVSCNKNKRDQIKNVIYVVDLCCADSIRITYKSDYFFKTNKVQWIYPLDDQTHNLYADGLLWIGTRNTTNEEEGYQMEVQFFGIDTNFNSQFGARVYVNDTILIDSDVVNNNKNTINLSGEIPIEF